MNARLIVTASLLVLAACSNSSSDRFASLDSAMEALRAKYEIPGGSLAVSHGGKLAHAQGYGWADVEAKTPVTANSLFRVASVSKVVTAAAVMRLHQEGRLDLEAKVFGPEGLLDEATYGKAKDARLEQITVRNLLQHTGGWNSALGYDPQYDVIAIARAMGVEAPASNRDVIRYMVQTRDLDVAPGGEYHYSNFGYNALGRVIEAVTGQPYAEYVEATVFAPAGITRMHLAGNLLADRVEDEVRYYDADEDVGESIDGSGAQVPISYGGLNFETMDAHGGWLASPTDLLRFLRTIDDRTEGTHLLAPETVQEMCQPPAELADAHYAMGWVISAHDRNHSGELQGGTAAYLVLRDDGTGWAAVFNHLPSSASDPGVAGAFFKELKETVSAQLDLVSDWPEEDLFSSLK